MIQVVLLYSVDFIASSAPRCYNFTSNTGEWCSGSTGDFGSANTHELISSFIKSRRQGLSTQTIYFYRKYLTRAINVIGRQIPCYSISRFLECLNCSEGGKHAYYRVLRAFYNWLYSRKSGYDLNPQNNPILDVDSPKVGKRILPSLTMEQVDILIQTAGNIRDKCIVSLLADSSMRLSELAGIQSTDINWESQTITIIGKGNKQRKAPFTNIRKSIK